MGPRAERRRVRLFWATPPPVFRFVNADGVQHCHQPCICDLNCTNSMINSADILDSLEDAPTKYKWNNCLISSFWPLKIVRNSKLVKNMYFNLIVTSSLCIRTKCRHGFAEKIQLANQTESRE